MVNKEIPDLVDKLRDIPTLSVVVNRVMELVNNPRTSAPQIAEVLKKDQVLTAKVLRLVNSSFYNFSTPVTDVSKALGFLGFNTVSVLVLGTSVFSAFEMSAAPYFNVREFWKHSLAVAIAAEMIAKKTKVGVRPEDAFTCGLLHDVGKIALFKVAPDQLKRVVEKSKKENISFFKAESELGLPGHTVLGERLAENWQLPVVIRKAIRFHHRDVEPLETVYAAMKPTLMVVTTANQLCKNLELGQSGDAEKPSYFDNYLEALGLNSDSLKQVAEQMEQEMVRVEGFLSSQQG
jgi:putative nucleotidyltransferase with HDIG domain